MDGEDMSAIEAYLMDKPEDCEMFQVRNDDLLLNHAIKQGDFVIVQKKKSASSGVGTLVLAFHEGEFVLGELCRDSKGFYLAGPHIRDYEHFGVVVGMFRKMKT